MEEEEEEAGGAGWLVSFADLMTLLFAAFVVLYGITPRGKSDRIVGVASSIREAFIEIPEDIPEPFRKGEIFKGKVIFKEAKRDRTFNPAIKRFNRTQTTMRGRNEDLQRVEIFLDKNSKGKGIQYSLRNAIEVSETEFGFKLQLLGQAFFIPGTNELTVDGKIAIKNLAKLLATTDKKILVEGHVDQTTPKGGYTYAELAALRASSVRAHLIKDKKVSASKVLTSSYGATRPIDTNRTKQGRAKNSRVEIKLIYQD